MKRPEKFESVIQLDDPHALFEEVCHIIGVANVHSDFTVLCQVFEDVLKLFRGEYPGYQKCNTKYHDLKHTTGCLLAMARLIHGAFFNGLTLPDKDVILGLASALLHDTGYIQSDGDEEGTGAKYTLVHVDRSIAFMDQYLAEAGFSSRDLEYCRCCIRCTGLDVKIWEIGFESPQHWALGCMLGTADLLAQMASRTYLERLPLLYQEFQEGKVPGFESELDLLKKTPAFWEFTQQRLAKDLGNVDRYMKDHFLVRWELDRNFYQEKIEQNINYLKSILENRASDYWKFLRRATD